jgi:hypothetical protein
MFLSWREATSGVLRKIASEYFDTERFTMKESDGSCWGQTDNTTGGLLPFRTFSVDAALRSQIGTLKSKSSSAPKPLKRQVPLLEARISSP